MTKNGKNFALKTLTSLDKQFNLTKTGKQLLRSLLSMMTILLSISHNQLRNISWKLTTNYTYKEINCWAKKSTNILSLQLLVIMMMKRSLSKSFLSNWFLNIWWMILNTIKILKSFMSTLNCLLMIFPVSKSILLIKHRWSQIIIGWWQLFLN